MNSVLRIALTYFRMVPLQKWMNVAGALLLALSVWFTITARGPNGALGAVICSVFGAMLVIVLPIFCGGGAMRAASSPLVMHLRPHGRVRMLLAATLVITLLAAIALVPVLAAAHTSHLMAPRNRPAEVPPMVVFAAAWALLASAWMLIFALSRAPSMMFLVGLLPLVIVKAGRALAGWLPDPALAFGIAIPAWLLFATWYLRTPTVHRVCLQEVASANSVNAPPFGPLQRLLDGLANLAPRERALRMHLLGTASPWTFALGGLWVIGLILVIQFLMPGTPRANAPVSPYAGMAMGLAPMLALMSGAFSYSAVRRARLLWLRAGLDRAALFAYSERLLARCVLTLLLAAGGAILLIVARESPAILPRLPQLVLALVLLGAAGLYAGMASTRGLEFWQVIAGIVIVVVGIAQCIGAIFPEKESVQVAVIAWVMSAGLPLLMREFARRRWLSLDWRVARLPQGWRIAST